MATLELATISRGVAVPPKLKVAMGFAPCHTRRRVAFRRGGRGVAGARAGRCGGHHGLIGAAAIR
jgi:hypothetical protein